MGWRKLILGLVSEQTAAKMEAESRLWMAVCGKCGYEISLWDLGGIRYGGRGKTATYMRCRSCHRLGWHKILKRELQP